MRKRKENTGKDLVSVNRGLWGCCIQQEVLWRSAGSRKASGAKLGLLCGDGPLKLLLEVTGLRPRNPEAEIRSRQGGKREALLKIKVPA